ncbi:hypothetical protein THIOM_001258 [Candidatus Thiomargarita nelsonii]|uniref:Uncharacterized protein n=1 Tax=Candidatus Thiomargarita nelsonii TaxID=1003181 RepID=A0A176S4I5_9GAMM|nr:hypothetical protein THIOM_001258 [Candidatus Thiomargarita nelsonii]
MIIQSYRVLNNGSTLMKKSFSKLGRSSEIIIAWKNKWAKVAWVSSGKPSI